ncbi:MAG: penicillin-binding transpeptidase domain-containing protein [Clostridiales bacterium]
MDNKQFKNRLLFFLGIFTIFFIFLIIRITWITYIKGEDYRKLVYTQQSKNGFIDAKRGTIYDRNYVDLAVSSIAYNISIEPNKILKNKNSKKNKDKLIEKLEKTLKVNKENLSKNINNEKIEYYVVKKKVDKEIGEDLLNFKKKYDLIGLNIEKTTKRYYPQKNLAAHVVGFTGVDNQGLEGIEEVMDEDLKGVPGKIVGDIDAIGNQVPFAENISIKPENGLNVVLTIDKRIQSIAETALEEAMETYKVKNGAIAIVMDPRNGDILAMTSKPDFDLNSPFEKPELDEFKDQEWTPYTDKSIDNLQKTVWRNKAVMDTYEPGSTFKAITSAIGLEEDKIQPNTIVNDYTINVSGYDINCWEPNAHGEEKFYQGVYNSCNPVFVKLALDIGIDTFYKYVRAFGFYDNTNINLPGEAASIFHKKPEKIDLAVTSFGQRFQVTPIQLITSYSAIANGGNLVKPRLIKEFTDSEGRIVKKVEPEIVRNVISQQTSETLRNILEGVVSNGTGMNAYVKGYKVAGKTGTSETTETETTGRYIASFSAFAPADNPVISVLVVVDNPRTPDVYFGGVIAAPVVSKIIENSLETMGVKRRYENDEKEKYYKLQDVRGKTIIEAEKELEESGFKVETVIDEKDNKESKSKLKVLDQVPEALSELNKGALIVLYSDKNLEKKEVKVPDLTNLSLDEVKNITQELGINLVTHGKGKSISQSITSGVTVNKGRVISVDFIQQVKD